MNFKHFAECYYPNNDELYILLNKEEVTDIEHLIDDKKTKEHSYEK